MSDLAERLATVRSRIAAAARRSGRDSDAVALLAVTKTFSADRVVEAIDLGMHRFGENRVQEAAGKIPEVEGARGRREWHLVGGLQRNKARRAVRLFSVIQSVDRAELAVTAQPAVLPVPFTCAVCHRTMLTNRFDRVDPTGN